MSHSTTSYFELFGLSPEFQVDKKALKQTYLELQQQAHPDKQLLNSGANERQLIEGSIAVNQAYAVLKDDASRAGYLLQLSGYEYDPDTATSTDVEFLMAQLELRERLESCSGLDEDAAEAELDKLSNAVRQLSHQWHQDFQQHFINAEYEKAAVSVNHMQFVQKLAAQIQQVESEIFD